MLENQLYRPYEGLNQEAIFKLFIHQYCAEVSELKKENKRLKEVEKGTCLDFWRGVAGDTSG